jgi:rod shape-determining protein MreC
MRNLLNFLARYNNLFIFFLLEGLAIYFVVKGNDYHNLRLAKGIRLVTLGMDRRITTTRTYLNLYPVNSKIAQENTKLRNQLEKFTRITNHAFSSVFDTLNNQQYVYTSAEIINNSTNKQKNFFTLNKGRGQGVDVDMAVISPDGVAGIIVSSSDNFSVGMSLLNIDFHLSARIKSSGYFGSVSWEGRDYRFAELKEIPLHVIINEGDTIETTGYSSIFPKGIFVGVVDSFEKAGGDFYRIRIRLATDFRRVNYVSVIGNLKKLEQTELEKQFQ